MPCENLYTLPIFLPICSIALATLLWMICVVSETLDTLSREAEVFTVGKSEIAFAGSLTFHQLCLLIEATCVAISVLLSLYLIWMHAFHYTKPNEQR
jgi:hypothetical protein